MRPGWRWGQMPGSCCLGSGAAGASQPGHLQALSLLLSPGSSPEPHAPSCSSGDTRGTCRAFPHPLLLPGAQCPASFPPGVGLLALVHTAGKRKWGLDSSTPQKGPLPLVLSPAAGGYQALLAFLGFSAFVQSPGRGYLPPKTTRIPPPGAETPSCSPERLLALGSPGNPARPSPRAPLLLCLSLSSLRDSCR